MVNSEVSCKNGGTASEKQSHVLYYHEIDPSGGTNYGKLTGRAWSSVFGTISFYVGEFPNTSCYGLTGDARQARIVKSGNTIVLTGCAYSSLLNDYILFNKSGATGTPSGWNGVTVSVEEDASKNVCSSAGANRNRDVDCFVKVPYLKISGCAWSSKNGYWAFGPNTSSFDGKNNCLPTGHNYILDTSGVGSERTNSISVTPLKSSVNIGQRVYYTFTCKPGYSRPVRVEVLDNEGNILKSVLSTPQNPISSPYSEIALSSVARVRLVCGDVRGLFSETQSAEGSGVSSSALVLSSFKVSPSVVVDGGIVRVEGAVSNRGIFASNKAYCTVKNLITGEQIAQTAIGSLNTRISIADTVVRDTVYQAECFYWIPTASRWDSIGTYDVAVKVLPNQVVERNVSGSVGLPSVSLSGANTEIAIPSGVHEVYVYVLEDRKGLRSIGDGTLHAIAVSRKEARSGVETDQQIKDRLFGNSPLTSKVSVVSGTAFSIARSALSGKILVAEARTRGGLWSQKVIWTDCIAATTPSTPTATAGNTSCTVSASDSNSSNYTYQYRKGTAGTWQSSNSFAGLTNNTAYTFYVRRKNASGSCQTYSSASSSVSCTPTCNATTPSTPTATAGNTSCTVSASDSNSSNYTYQYRKGTAGTWQSSNSFTGLTNNTAYTFYVRRKNASGSCQTYSSASFSVSCTPVPACTNATTPSTPTATAGNTSCTVSASDTNSSNYTYQYRKGTAGTWQSSNSFTGLTNNTAYTFYVRRKNASGSCQTYSSASSSVSCTPVTHDFTTLAAAGNDASRGIWSNGTTMWVSDSTDDKLYAYHMSTKARDSSKDFNTLNAAGNNNPYGIWSNGTTMWVVDISDAKLYAYSMSTKARDSSKDISTAGNDSPRDIWSDGTTMWVSHYQDKVTAYTISTKARDTSKEFTSATLSSAGISKLRGIWSDRTTIWLADWTDRKLYAYTLNSKARDSSKDVNISGIGGWPHGLWGNTAKIWVDTSAKTIRAVSY